MKLRAFAVLPWLLAAPLQPQTPAPPLQPQTPAPTAAAAPAPVTSDDAVRRVSVAEAKKALADGSAILVDVRYGDAYALSHAKGARHIPIDQIAARASELPRDRFIITYCT